MLFALFYDAIGRGGAAFVKSTRRTRLDGAAPAPIADARRKPYSDAPAGRRGRTMALAKPRKAAARSKPRSRTASRDALFDNFLPYLITRLAWELNSDLVEKLRRQDINLARWRILAVLAMGDGLTITEIIERAMMQQSALSRVLMKMEDEGLVTRTTRSEDARYVEVFLTDKGRDLFETLDPVVRRRQERLLAGFSPEETEAAFALMRRLSANLKT